MEKGKKNKKNKKKKNKQSAAKPAESVPVAVNGSTSVDQTVNGYGENCQGHIYKASDNPNDVQQSDAYMDTHHTSGSEDVSVEVQVKQLQNEKDLYIKKEVDLCYKISQLQNEKDLWCQKEASLEQQIKQLQKEKDAFTSKEDDYKEKVSQLVTKASASSLKEVELEDKIKQLEKETESWVQKENIIEGTIAGLNADNSRLRSQVMQLEESVRNLVQENDQLIRNISDLQSQIQAHSSTIEHDQNDIPAELFSSVGPDPMVGIVAPFIAESSTIASEQIDGTAERLASVPVVEKYASGPNPVVGTTEKLAADVTGDLFSESSEKPPLLGEEMKPFESIASLPPRGVGDYGNHQNLDVPNDEPIVSEEIVQIPLDETEVGVAMVELEDSRSVETTVVPITDAPLIGAPFRLISFVARYVSGADLVDKSRLKSGQ